MAGNKIGGLHARDTNFKRYGRDFYRKIGEKGGAKSKTGGFAAEGVGKDGMTGRERAKKWGVVGGKLSRRNARVRVDEYKTATVWPQSTDPKVRPKKYMDFILKKKIKIWPF